jgi:hypothetical protein
MNSKNDTNSDFVDSREIKGIVKLFLRKDGIVEQEWDETNLEIDEHQVMKTQELLGDLVGRKRVRIFVTTKDFSNMTPEGRKVAATKEANKYTIAVAVLIDSLAKKLVFNFFITLNKPILPIKGFTNKEEAIQWLMSMNASTKI